MKWVSVVLATFLSVSGLAKVEPPLWSEFSVKVYPAVGLGILPMADSPGEYISVKLFPIQYGPSEIGFSFGGVGYSPRPGRWSWG